MKLFIICMLCLFFSVFLLVLWCSLVSGLVLMFGRLVSESFLVLLVCMFMYYRVCGLKLLWLMWVWVFLVFLYFDLVMYSGILLVWLLLKFFGLVIMIRWVRFGDSMLLVILMLVFRYIGFGVWVGLVWC